MIIGFTGKMRSGKDTAALALTDFDSLSFSRPLKESAMILFNLSHEQVFENKETIDTNWGKSPRQILQWLGTKIREQNSNHFVTLLKQKLTGRNTVITDVRFENEAKLIHELGGIIIKITRGVEEREMCWRNLEIRGHESECGTVFDYEIINNKSIEELHKTVLDIIKCSSLC